MKFCYFFPLLGTRTATLSHEKGVPFFRGDGEGWGGSGFFFSPVFCPPFSWMFKKPFPPPPPQQNSLFSTPPLLSESAHSVKIRLVPSVIQDTPPLAVARAVYHGCPFFPLGCKLPGQTVPRPLPPHDAVPNSCIVMERAACSPQRFSSNANGLVRPPDKRAQFIALLSFCMRFQYRPHRRGV